uniref:Uncharacterized protein n=1 Tax=Anguilla anguilla TaxID=7936 RepID=A0A0E9X0G8_ANGAN
MPDKRKPVHWDGRYAIPLSYALAGACRGLLLRIFTAQQTTPHLWSQTDFLFSVQKEKELHKCKNIVPSCKDYISIVNCSSTLSVQVIKQLTLS